MHSNLSTRSFCRMLVIKYGYLITQDNKDISFCKGSDISEASSSSDH